MDSYFRTSHRDFANRPKLLKWAKVFVIVLLALGAIAGLAAYSTQRATEVAHRMALAHATADGFYTELIEQYFFTYEPQTLVCINKTYDGACLNIVIANNLAADARTATYANNLSAIGSNLIVADTKVLDLLLLASSYGFKAQLSKFIFSDGSLGPFAPDVLWAQRYVAVWRDLLSKSGGQVAAHEIGRVKAGITGASATMADAPAEIRKVYGGDPKEFIRQLTSLNFGFMLQHEIGHLKMPILRRWLLRVRALASRELSAIGRSEEDEVDELARDQTTRLMERARKLSPIMEGTDIERSILFSNFLFFWTDGLFSFYEGRDKLYAEDFLFEINFSECSLDRALLAAIPDEVLAMLPVLDNGRLRPLPVLTGAEFSELGQYLRDSRGHSHSAVRGAYLLEAIIANLGRKFPEFDREQIGVVPAALIRAMDGREEKDSRARAALPATKMKRSQFAMIQDRERGHLCRFDDCEVLRSDITRVELLADADDIHEIVLRTTWPGAKKDALWQHAMNVAADAVGVERSEIEAKIDELIDRCPGSYFVAQRGSAGEFIYVGRAATKGVISVRVLAAE